MVHGIFLVWYMPDPLLSEHMSEDRKVPLMFSKSKAVGNGCVKLQKHSAHSLGIRCNLQKSMSPRSFHSMTLVQTCLFRRMAYLAG